MMWTDPVSAPIGEFVQRKKTMKSWIRYDYVRKMLDKKSNITSAGSLAGNSWRACKMKREGNCSDEENNFCQMIPRLTETVRREKQFLCLNTVSAIELIGVSLQLLRN